MEIQGDKMLTLIGGLFCVGFINLAGVWRQRLALIIGLNWVCYTLQQKQNPDLSGHSKVPKHFPKWSEEIHIYLHMESMMQSEREIKFFVFKTI